MDIIDIMMLLIYEAYFTEMPQYDSNNVKTKTKH